MSVVPKQPKAPLHVRLRGLRNRAGLSQPELFRRVEGVGFDTIKGIEVAPPHQRHRYPSGKVLEALAEVLPIEDGELPELELARVRDLFNERVVGLEAAIANLEACPDVRRLLDPRRATVRAAEEAARLREQRSGSPQRESRGPRRERRAQ